MLKIIDPVAFYIGPLAIRWYGIIISTALLVGLIFSMNEARRKGINQEIILDIVIWVIPAAIIGARLYYVVFNFDYYRDNLIYILATRQGGLAIHGAIIGGLLVMIILTKKRRVSFWKIVDTFAPGMILGQAIGRWGNFVNQEAYGGIVTQEYISHFPELIRKQMYIQGAYRHPTFLYESVWNIFVFLILLWLRNKQWLKTGDLFIAYAIGYSIGRFFIEGMRTDSLMLGSFRVAQVVSAIVVVLGSLFIYYRHRWSVKS